MNSIAFQVLLAVCTILGGLSALVYFHEKLGLPSLAKARIFLFGAPKIAITPSSIGAYVNTNPRSRNLDKAIADDFGAKVERSESDWEWLRELTEAVGVASIRDLDRLVKKHARTARLLARSFQARDTVPTAHGVQLALQIEAMRRKGLDGFTSMLGELKLSSAGAGFARELWNDYQRIVKHGA